MTNDNANQMAVPDPAEAGRGEVESEVNEKLKLITASYAEVLDATKHQDDKVGQLLTSISFLTAAVLALAALGAGNLLTREFYVLPVTLPLGLITLVVFLVGVAFSVMLLLTSLATPLRLPGIGKSSRAASKILWVRNIPGSQMYFFEIARMSVGQWEHKWGAPSSDLTRERVDSLIQETHNLGLRTSAKYDRTTEAVALLSLSLFAFALATVFAAIVASSPQSHKPIPLHLWQRIAIAGIFACYFWMQLISRIRYNRQAVDETPPRGKDVADRRTYLGELGYSIFGALLIASILVYGAYGSGDNLWASITSVLALASIISFWFAAWPSKPTVGLEHPLAERSARRYRQAIRTNCILTGLTIAVTAISLCGGLNGLYAYQLGAASFAVLGLIGASILQPTLRLRETRRNYWEQARMQESSS